MPHIHHRMNPDLRLLGSFLDLIGLFRICYRLRLDAFKSHVNRKFEPIQIAHLLRQHGDEHGFFEFRVHRNRPRCSAEESVIREQRSHCAERRGFEKISPVSHMRVYLFYLMLMIKVFATRPSMVTTTSTSPRPASLRGIKMLS